MIKMKLNKQALIYILYLLFYSFSAIANDNETDILKKKFPEMLNSNNVGKEFWFTIPPCFEDESSAYPNFIKIFVTTPIRTKVRVSVPGKEFYTENFTIPNDVIEFNILPDIGQPFRRKMTEPVPAEQIYAGAGIHLLADDPIVVYVVVRYKRTSDGFLAIPVGSLGSEYIASSYTEDKFFKQAGWGNLPSQIGIVAAYDDTRVDFKLGGNPETRTSGGMIPGQTTTLTLNKGDVWMFSSNSGGDLSGSLITSTKPVGVISGNQCANIPNGNQWCDYTVEMDLPTHTWGKFYHTGKVPGRKKSAIVRVFARYPDTKVFRDGEEVAFLTDAGGVLGNAYTEMRIVPDKETPRSAVFSGDKPIGVTLYNCGVQEDGAPEPNSDPFQMVIAPIEQYQNEIIFCTPAINGGESFKENYLNLVYETDLNGAMPNDMEFAQVFAGQFSWSKINETFVTPDEPFRYDYYGKKFALKTIKLPSDGVFKIRAKFPFAAYSFGYDDKDSYGYPTSAALAVLIFRDTIPPLPKWTMDCDGNVKSASATDKPDDPMVRSNLSSIVFQNGQSDNYEFKSENFIPGEASSVNWELKIQNPLKDAKAVITFIDRSGNDTTITITYTSPKITVLPAQHDFGKFKKNENSTFQFHVKNESLNKSVMIEKIDFKYKNQGFTIIYDDAFPLPYNLEPQASLPFKVTFTASLTGNFLDSIGVKDDCLYRLCSEVKAQVGAPVIMVTDAEFGKVLVGEPAEKEAFIINEGNAPLSVHGYEGLLTSVFVPDFGGEEISNANPLIIPVGERFKFKVTFTPLVEKLYADRITFYCDGDINDNECYLSGEGVKTKLWASSENWGLKRINRTLFPAGPYTTTQAVKLINQGDEDVTINQAQLIESINPEAFDIKLDDIKNITLKKDSSAFFNVTFKPEKTGLHRIKIKFDIGSESEAESVLEGIGAVPRIQTEPVVDFGVSIVGNTALPQTRNITITNENYEYADPLEITDLIPEPEESISTDGVNYSSTQGFMFDKAALNLPVKLNPGQSLTFPAKYVAPFEGNHTARLNIISDAETEKSITFNGQGIPEKFDFIFTEKRICVNSSVVINCALINNGLSDITVTGAILNQSDNYFALENPDEFALGFTLTPSQVKNFNVIYTPKSVGQHKLEIVFENNTAHNPHYKAEVLSSAFVYRRSLKPQVTLNEISIGESLDYSVRLEAGDDILELNTKEIDMKIRFNSTFLKIDKASVQVGSTAEGKIDIAAKNFNMIDPDKNIIEIDLKLTAKGDYNINESIELVKMKFTAYLPSYSGQNQNPVNKMDTSVIYLLAEATGMDCLALSPENIEVKLNPICIYNLRPIVYSGNTYYLSEISPNPANSLGAEAEFSIGITAFTEIKIYNSNSELVMKPLAAEVQSGVYRINIPVDKLSGGAYFLEIVSGPYKDTKKFVVVK